MTQSKKPATHVNSVGKFLEPLGNSDIPEAWGKFYSSYFEGVSAMTTEIMGFIETRVSRDMELGKDLSHCQDWTSASRVQSEWSRQTQEDYLEESRKLSEMATTMVQRTLEPWTHFTR